MPKRKMAVWGGLTNSCEKKRSEKQRRKERYKHLNAEFQRIARRDKKAFLSEQCKEIEEKNRMGKTKDLFKKSTDTKGIFHAKMGSIKDRNGMDITKAEDIKKRWQEYTEELYKLKQVFSGVVFLEIVYIAAAAAAKLLQSCLTLCDPIDGSTPGSPIPGVLQARTLEWVAISFSSIYSR